MILPFLAYECVSVAWSDSFVDTNQTIRNLR
jgi:hypothetical protein